MSTDLITVQKDDIVDLVAEMVDFRRLRYVLVEDEQHHLKGVVSAHNLLKWYSTKNLTNHKEFVLVQDIMIKDPITIPPTESITTAIELMDEKKIGCLPVVENNKLVGLVTERNFRAIASRLIKRLIKATK